MKNYFKRMIGIAFVFIIAIVLTGCTNEKIDGDKVNGKNKIYSFPVADFIPSGLEYNGSGKIEWSSKNEESIPKYADLYVSTATIEDAVEYVQKLKLAGLHNANAYHEEQTGFDEWGSYSWVGVNSNENFSISVTLTEESTPLNLVDASYNLSIVMSDENPYGE